ncbi:MAG: hypothetical protein HQL74_13470, partial [Magnetococcales bacterium]|nr:hypothetical protein [Magnetococcales bacterium]
MIRLCASLAKVCGIEVKVPSQKNEQNNSHVIGLPDGMELIKTFEFGTVTVIEALWERLGIGKIMREKMLADGGTVPYDCALLAMVANRLCEPTSKLGVWERWLKKVHLPSCNNLKLDNMYEAMDLLYEHSQIIEKEVFFNVTDLFSLEVDVVYYDTTTASFSIDEEDEDDDKCEDKDEEGQGECSTEEKEHVLRKFGPAKEGFWSVQIVVGLFGPDRLYTKEELPLFLAREAINEMLGPVNR